MIYQLIDQYRALILDEEFVKQIARHMFEELKMEWVCISCGQNRCINSLYQV